MFAGRGACVADADRGAGEPRGHAALEQPLQINRDVSGERLELSLQREYLRGRLEPAAGHSEEMVDRRMAGKHVGGPALDHPADPAVGERPLRGHGHGNSVEHVADGGKFDDDDRAG